MINAEGVLEAIRVLDGLEGLEAEKSDFYYDETNNYRKVRLRDGRLNFEGDGDFFLGGIVLRRNETLDIDELKSDIRLDKSAHEVKFKHVASGNLNAVINSKKIKRVLEFLNENEVSIHLQRVNVLYWSLIDIIESVMVECEDKLLILYHLQIKDRLYHALNHKRTQTLSILSDFAYPDVEGSRIADFYSELIKLVRPQVGSGDFLGEMLTRSLELGKALDKAPFIQGDERGILLGDFSHFYRHRALMFPESMHYFDAEDQVEEKIRATGNAYRESELSNYYFINSRDSCCIQLADVTVGYFARLMNFCKDRNVDELRAVRGNLNATQLDNLRLARELIERSDRRNRAYFHHIIPISDHGHWGDFVY